MQHARLRWLMLILAFLTALTMHLLLFSYSQLKKAILLEMQLTYAEAGFIISMSVLALVTLRISCDVMIDSLGAIVAMVWH